MAPGTRSGRLLHLADVAHRQRTGTIAVPREHCFCPLGQSGSKRTV